MIEDLESWKIVPVVAINRVSDALPLANALSEAGLPVAEITLRTEAGLGAISAVADLPDFTVGAGTVHTADQAKAVADAGAKFVVTPGFNPKTVQWCLDNNMPIYPGVSSPTDLESAIEFGLEVVKFFPAERIGGIPMIKALQGPYGDIRFIPTGGINASNLKDYLSLPSVVACGGSWMVKGDLISGGQFDEIIELTKEALASVNA
jgi:2-dehydro-3-deoxyphosphogluconate aldolase/(4S)-4-hydroxy-2-oxoglutarate aldolase